MRRLKARFRSLFLGSSLGFTLIEVLVSVGILGITMSLVGGALFQAFAFQRHRFDDVIATKELRHANSWFAGDALNAEETDLVGGAPPVDSTTLTWTDGQGNLHTVSYGLVGSSLMRNDDGDQITLARHVISVGFSLSAEVLTFDLEVEAAGGGTESTSLQTYLRELQ